MDPVGYLQKKLDQHEASKHGLDHVADWTEGQKPLTFGPFGNNLSSDYAFDKGAWSINFIDKMSPDIVIIFLSKLSQLYRKTDVPTLSLPIRRNVKDMLVKDNFPHHISKEW